MLRTVIDDSPEAISALLRTRPVRELPGAGGKTAALLGEYGLHTVGDVADVPQHTLQRLLGARAGRVTRFLEDVDGVLRFEGFVETGQCGACQAAVDQCTEVFSTK
ncbi:DNA polymerase thumb domain-containing protein [Streptomyces sp. NBC_01235]|uniref:DNA polymerase thumb domain-containing protein n=1 Tax=Streptomyces sp. NBC_01235 TaxID=2903788 RepID=UPI003FA371FF